MHFYDTPIFVAMDERRYPYSENLFNHTETCQPIDGKFGIRISKGTGINIGWVILFTRVKCLTTTPIVLTPKRANQ